ncbi:hypothetical protein ABL78_1377 [Leptomonas seymouri]|uniref:Centrosomal protein 20 n=1 Tax=Leptomonas seymouri TaxID=5684 RepID=A0A0N1IAR5_LEPSE|nr:hypothetical protein ABL78_1377 [Leptomonas seymouri]|eukprot:KPI89501.1 hypothetical protein ABL78_1377 [Leptomonas seymouri]
MPSQESLKAAMRESLEANGTIGHVKAELRAAIVERLTDVTADGDSRAVENPLVPPENMIINELIKEYLTFNGLEHTLATFQLEGRTPDCQLPRRVLASELNMAAAPSSVPLLYAILHEARLSKEMNS